LQQRPKTNSLKQVLQLFSEQRCSREKYAFVNWRKNSGERTNKKKFLTSCCRVQKTLDKTEEAAQGGSKQLPSSEQAISPAVCLLPQRDALVEDINTRRQTRAVCNQN